MKKPNNITIDQSSLTNSVCSAHIDPEMIQTVPSVIQREIDKASQNILETSKKFAKESDPYDLRKCRNSQITGEKFTTGDVEYFWVGGFGSIFESMEEKYLAPGTVRMILNMPFHVFMSLERGWKFWRKHRTCWTIPNRNSEWIRDLKQIIFR